MVNRVMAWARARATAVGETRLETARGGNCQRPARASRLALVGVVIGTLALAGGCERQGAGFTPPPPPDVTIANPVQRDIPDTLEFTATIRGAQEVEIRSRVDGFLAVKHTDGGVRVEAGQELFTLDARPFAAAVREGEATLAQRRYELAQAELSLERERGAVERGGSSVQQVDDAAAARDVALAQVDLAQAQLDRLNLDLEWAAIRAPITGRMGFAQVEQNDLVSVNDWLATIIDDSKVYAVYDIDERTLLELREKYNNLRPGEDGRPLLVVRLGLASEDGFPHVGRFYRAEAGINPETGTMRVEAEFENADGSILPGTFVRVQPVFGDRPALLVPDLAVLSDPAGRYVLAVDEGGMVERIAVRLDGAVYERMRPVVEVIGETLDGDEAPEPRLTTRTRVIVNGLQRVRAGMEVVALFEGEERPEGSAAPGAEAANAQGGGGGH